MSSDRKPKSKPGHLLGAQDKPAVRFDKWQDKHESKRVVGDLKSQRARDWTEKLLTRTTSGAIYAIVTLVCLYLGPYTTCILIAGMSWLACSEFFRMMRMYGRTPSEYIGLAFAVAFPIAALFPHVVSRTLLVVLVVACGLWYIMVLKTSITDVAITIFGPIYCGLLLSSVVDMRLMGQDMQGGLITFAAMGSIWLNDATAYFVGSKFGRHKMVPRISPNKSWEGFFGGLVGSVVAWVILYFLHVTNISLVWAIVCGLITGCAGVLGDLFESRIKRGAGVKDSGNVMPGHGGLLDRCDSLIFGCVIADILLHIGGVL